MEKYLLVETHDDSLEIAEINDSELAKIKPVIQYIINHPIGHDESDFGNYGHLDGWETLVMFLPDDGVIAISDIRVVKVEEILL